jgi:hypothetical protein
MLEDVEWSGDLRLRYEAFRYDQDELGTEQDDRDRIGETTAYVSLSMDASWPVLVYGTFARSFSADTGSRIPGVSLLRHRTAHSSDGRSVGFPSAAWPFLATATQLPFAFPASRSPLGPQGRRHAAQYLTHEPVGDGCAAHTPKVPSTFSGCRPGPR